MKELSFEEKREKVKNLRPIDDVFFEVLARNVKVMQEILRTILEDHELVVEDVIVQNDERNLYGRSVRLDALCILGNDVRCNVEVQRADNDDHFRRVRFNESIITVKDSQAGTGFKDIPDVYVVYISESDFIGEGHTIYHVNKIIAETGQLVEDGTKEIYVNATVDDGTDIANLMSCFTRREVVNSKFPELSAEVKNLKNTEGGLNAMCKVMEYYEGIARQEGRAEGREEGRKEGRAEGREEGRKEGRAEGREEGRAEGREEGRAEGRLEGKEETFFELVEKGIITVKVGAENLGLSEDEFIRRMEENKTI